MQTELELALKDTEHELIFVDDGSRDRTIDQIKRTPGVRVLEFEKNAGQSAAIYAGLAAANGKILVLIDGDLQNDPSDIPRLLAEINQGADLVCGYRLKRQDIWFKRVKAGSPTGCGADSPRMASATQGARSKPCGENAAKR